MSTETLYLSALRTQSLPFRIEAFIGFKVVDIANRTLVQAIRDEAILKKMPQRYIDGIHAEFDGRDLWVWVDFKGKKGEKLDLFFEEGTDDHEIKPRFKKALRWFGHGSIGIVTAARIFSKSNWVSGIEARHIFRNGAAKGYPEFKKLLKKEIEEYIEETRLFGR